MNNDNLSQKGYELSIEYLLQNQTQYGMAAARVSQDMEKGTYASLFPRDIGTCTLGMLSSDNQGLIDLAKKSIENLVPAQSKRGQFPQNFEPRSLSVATEEPNELYLTHNCSHDLGYIGLTLGEL